MNRSPHARRPVQARVRPMRREGPPLRTVQVLAGLAMSACLVALAGLCLSPSFAAGRLEISGARFTSQDVIRSIVDLDSAPNLFTLRTDRIADELVKLPAVESASVTVRLPSTISVTIVERVAKLTWVIGDHRYAVDADGLLFGEVDGAGNPVEAGSAGASPAGSGAPATLEVTGRPSLGASSSAAATPGVAASPSPGPQVTPRATPRAPTPKTTARATPRTSSKASASPSPALSFVPPIDASLVPSLLPVATPGSVATPGPLALSLPVVVDRRTVDAGLGLGDIVDPTNLDAGFRLAGLTPPDVGSTCDRLAVVLDDTHGFTLSCPAAGWVAEFGFYATTVRKVDVIPAQVRDLRSLLFQFGDAHVAWVWLVADVSDSHVNTYLPR